MRAFSRLVVATLAIGSTVARYNILKQLDYAPRWATAGSDRGVAPFLEKFGPIDVACTFDVVRVGLDGRAGPELTFRFADGTTLRATPDNATARFRERPAVCEYERGDATADAAMLMVANGPGYLFRLWPLFLNKLLFASEAKLRPFVWLGELPDSLTEATAPGCLSSKLARSARKGPKRRLSVSYNADAARRGDATRVSNHHVKMPAALATLAHPTVAGVYYVDLDSAAQAPFNLTGVRDAHERGFSDVAFKWTRKKGAATLRWKVMGSRFYARDTAFGRNFLVRWFENRCSFKDQYSLWHTILELAAEARCVDYRGDVWRDYDYDDARHVSPAKAGIGLQLTCARVREACPNFRYGNDGGPCRVDETPNCLDAVLHHAIPPSGDGLTNATYRTAAGRRAVLVMERVCVYDGERVRVDDARDVRRGVCAYLPLDAYLRRLGVAGRDRATHPWGEADS
mmetsp:Transcript_7160/g.22555  ORF Transcript_7160/g.22555 Transcript_7160/m.22555 type:complete len:458 (+) Transcript_7160:2180-3553(+)